MNRPSRLVHLCAALISVVVVPALLAADPDPLMLLDEQTVKHRGTITGVAFTPDGKMLATSANDLAFWDLTGQEPKTLPAAKAPRVRSLAFSPDGKLLAAGSWGPTATLLTVSATELKERAVVKGHDYGAGCVAFTPDGKILATGGDDGGVFIWDITGDKPKEMAVIKAGGGGVGVGVGALAYTPDGKTLLVATWGGGTLTFYDVTGKEPKQTGQMKEKLNLAWLSPRMGKCWPAGRMTRPSSSTRWRQSPSRRKPWRATRSRRPHWPSHRTAACSPRAARTARSSSGTRRAASNSSPSSAPNSSTAWPSPAAAIRRPGKSPWRQATPTPCSSIGSARPNDEGLIRHKGMNASRIVLIVRLREAFAQRRCVSAWLGYGDVLFLGFGDGLPRLCEDDGRRRRPPFELETNFADWLIEGPTAPVTADPDRAQLEAAAQSLVGEQVTNWELLESNGLRLTFSGTKVLKVVPWSAADGLSDAWCVESPDGLILAVATDGQAVVVDAGLPVSAWFSPVP